jgi:hypothetical protein
MRKLVAIVVAAIAIVAVIIYFARSPGDTDAGVAVAHEPERAQPLAQHPQEANHNVAPAVTDTSAQPQASARKNSPPSAAPLTAEQQERAACRAVWERRRAREREALEAEPKDAAWAYPMEQKLREYLTQKLQSGRLEVLGIDCKTTFCEIKALVLYPEGSGEFTEAVSDFNAAISDINGKPWNDFRGMGTSASQESGKTFYFGHLTRPKFKEPPQPAQEAQAEAACTARSNEKQKRERAARDAQSKDTSWAEPMEQLLREYLTTQMAKQPVERIDIDCRTTYCRITGSGRTNDAYLAFQKFAQAAADEPWANLRNGEGGGGGDGVTWKQEYFLYRR